jgi:hypothetical protein
MKRGGIGNLEDEKEWGEKRKENKCFGGSGSAGCFCVRAGSGCDSGEGGEADHH